MGAFRTVPPAVALILLLGIAAGCGDDLGPSFQETNVPPVTTISGGPEPFDQTSYRVTLHWYGEDADGRVVGFDFAWEDTTDWHETSAAGSTFVLACDTCCVFDTLTGGAGADSVVERFFAYHTFFVRAVDEDGAKDPTPAFLTFNATTVAPRSWFTYGPPTGSVSATSVRFEWEGEDEDGVLAAYEYFHATKGELRESYGFQDAVGVTRELWNRLGWTRVPAGSTHVTLSGLVSGYGENGANRHLIFLRAVDDAGAVEQVPVRGTNYREWGVGASLGGIRIHSDVMGSGGTGSDREGTMFEGSDAAFAWFWTTGSVRPSAYSHAYDNHLWTAWDTENHRFPAEGVFRPTRGRHSFFARVLDEGNQVTTAEFPFEVIAGPADAGETNILLLSAFHMEDIVEFYPSPDTYREFWTDSILVGFPNEYIDPREEHEDEPPWFAIGSASTLIVPTEDWESGQPPIVAEWYQNGSSPVWSYLDAGGNVILLGFFPSWNYLPDRAYRPAPDGYIEYRPCFWWSSPWRCDGRLVWKGEGPEEWEPFDHPMYEFCAVETTWLDETIDFMAAAEAVYPGLPDLAFDPSRSRNFRRFDGLWNCERSTLRSDRGVVPLYEFARPGDPPAVTDPPNRRTAAHWVPSDGRRGHLVYLGFPAWYFPVEQSRAMMETILTDLLGEESRN